MNREEILEAVRNDVDLSGVDLSGVDLSGANLSGITLIDVNLSTANLSSAILDDANLLGANLSDANLTEANLDNVELIGAFLINTQLHRGFLLEAKLIGADLTNAKLTKAELSDAKLLHATLTNADLTNADLTNADLTNANLTNANLTNANLTNANLTNANLTNANLTNANLTNANLTNANITDIINADLTEEQMAQILDVAPQEGVAYEIHNAFASFIPKEAKYLSIIQQPQNESYGNIYDYIREKFTEQIEKYFPGDELKLEKLRKLITKIKYSLIPESEKDLVVKSIDFAFSQGKEFIEQYITSFIDDSYNAYTGSGDNTSCVKGIIERFILSIGTTVQILCLEECDEKYKELNRLFNTKFDINEETKRWFELEEVIEMTGEDRINERREHFIKYMLARAEELGDHDENLEAKIRTRADEISYSFDDLRLGGSRRNKSNNKRKGTKRKRMGKRKGMGTKRKGTKRKQRK